MTKINIKKLPKSEVEIEGEIAADVFESYFSKALKHLGENVELDGFRERFAIDELCYICE